MARRVINNQYPPLVTRRWKARLSDTTAGLLESQNRHYQQPEGLRWLIQTLGWLPDQPFLRKVTTKVKNLQEPSRTEVSLEVDKPIVAPMQKRRTSLGGKAMRAASPGHTKRVL
jgi:hypothetical protein